MILFFLPVVNIMTKRKKTRKRGRKRRKKRQRGGAKGKAGIPESLLNFALIVPEEGVNIAYGAYARFMKPFAHTVMSTVKDIDNPKAILKAMERTIKKPKFKAAWAKSVAEIFDILLIPIIPKLLNLIEVEGLNIIKAFAKILGKGAYTIGQTIATSLEAAMSVVPGVGSALDILTIAQGLLNAFATLTMESLKIITKIIITVLSVAGLTIDPLLEIAPGMYHIISALFSSSLSTRKTKKKKKKRKNSSLSSLGVET